MKKKILITPKSFFRARNKADEIFSQFDLDIVENNTGKTLTKQQMIELCSDVDGVIVGLDPMDEEVIRSAKNLKAISKYGVGLDNIDLKVAEELGIKVKKAEGTNTRSVAELTIGLFFALSRSIPKAVIDVKDGRWDRTIGTEIGAKVVGIIGFGAIGREVAKMSSGLEMEIMAYDPYFNDIELTRAMNVKMTNIDEILEKADFVTLHLPLNEETNKIINSKTLSKMKQTAYLVNTARGELVDEDALYEALKNGIIAGAAQDVFSQEPPDKQNKLLSLNNFILTPHIGAYTKEATERMVVISAKNLIEMLF
ncbi:Phosphoglycerate dehydrogenase [Tepidanaerobacter acetatoxydans Re1]|uniref:2-oxoglutarate reductase n=1 Tax=Tepidanaerobacter acetatoxydans (strain DSM 21804 / JCM 16047 / Re1) TaxID=1209989 RepID=F4LX87_TEPAE|nr:phosphoglycerate dehydrogenase [Tepidanaerobacter acetatoxydans]AEE91886.1 Phosphoglycerate dehydrogenase [Tepidanaerobacter acetatoxydans Re1]CDI40842.1 Phosphoglycerate dehydrogenase [Tepidanaerobacter acetatoxydans Re1]